MCSRSTAERWGLRALAGLLLAGAAIAAGPDFATRVPAGAEVYLEVSSTGGLAAELDRDTSRIFQLVQSEGFQGFHDSKLGLKLVERFRAWLDRFVPDLGSGAVARKLLGGAGALAIYDISELRFLYVVEGAAAGAIDGLLASSKKKPEKLTVDGIQLLAIEEEGTGFYLRRPGNLLILGNDRELMLKAAKLVPGTSLAEEEAFGRLFSRLPAGLARIFVPARTFASVYMRSYWVGGRDALPPAAALAACLRKADGAGEAYEEVRLRDLDLPPATPVAAAASLAKLLPAWTFREVGSRDSLLAQLARVLAVVVPRDGSSGEDGPFARLTEAMAEHLEAVEAYGVAGGLEPVAAAGRDTGPAPKDRLGAAWPPTGSLYLRPRGVVALSFGDPASIPVDVLKGSLARYLGERLETAAPPEWKGEQLDLPLFQDLSPCLRVVGSTLLLATSPDALDEAAKGSGPAFAPARAGSFRQAWVSGPAMAKDLAGLGARTNLADDWFGRNLKDFVRLHLSDPLAAAFDGLQELGLEARGDAGAVEETLRIRF